MDLFIEEADFSVGESEVQIGKESFAATIIEGTEERPEIFDARPEIALGEIGRAHV